MRFGLREVLLVIAIILFVIAAIGGADAGDLLAFGLACFAGALLVESLGIGFGGRRR